MGEQPLYLSTQKPPCYGGKQVHRWHKKPQSQQLKLTSIAARPPFTLILSNKRLHFFASGE